MRCINHCDTFAGRIRCAERLARLHVGHAFYVPHVASQYAVLVVIRLANGLARVLERGAARFRHLQRNLLGICRCGALQIALQAAGLGGCRRYVDGEA